MNVNFRGMLVRARKLPPHVLYPLVLLALIVLLLLVHATFTRPAVPPARAPAPVAASAPAVVPAPARAAPASAHAAPAAAPSAPASAAAAVPAPVLPPAGVTAGYVHEIQQGRDQFGAWLTLRDMALKSPTLSVTVPTVTAGAKGARRAAWTAWVHVTEPVQTVTLREAGGGAAVSATVAGRTVSLPSSVFVAPRSVQGVIGLVPGWYLMKLQAAEQNPADLPLAVAPSRVEVQLGSTNLNPEIPVPYALPPAAPASAPSTAPAPAATAGPDLHRRPQLLLPARAAKAGLPVPARGKPAAVDARSRKSGVEVKR